MVRPLFERLFGKVFSLDHLRVVGYLCYAINLTQKDKFGHHSILSIFMGYSYAQKGYHLLALDSGKFFTSRDVTFHEIVFPFDCSSLLSSPHLSSSDIEIQDPNSLAIIPYIGLTLQVHVDPSLPNGE